MARERPYARECRESALAARTDDCESDALNRSFYSGHTTTTFAAAAGSWRTQVQPAPSAPSNSSLAAGSSVVGTWSDTRVGRPRAGHQR